MIYMHQFDNLKKFCTCFDWNQFEVDLVRFKRNEVEDIFAGKIK